MTRARFVKTDVRAGQVLRSWLDLHPNPIAAAELTLRSLRERADWRTHRVIGSNVQLAADLGLTPKTFGNHTVLLSDLGLLEKVGTAKNGEHRDSAGWMIPEDIERWLQEGEPFPAAFLALLTAAAVFSGRVDLRAASESSGEVVATQVAAVTEVAATPHLGSHDSAPQSSLPSTEVVTTEPQVPSPAETATVEVVDGEEVVDPSAPSGDAVQQVLDALSACSGKEVGRNRRSEAGVQRLLDGGWTVDEIKRQMLPKIVKAGRRGQTGGGLVIAMLEALGSAPERIERQQDRERRQAKQDAAECEHGTPNGTFRQENGRSLCPQCNGAVLRERESAS